MTRLEVFLKSHGIRPALFARESAYTYRHLFELRMGTIDPTRRCMLDFTETARRITREALRPGDLFDLKPSDERCVLRRLDARELARRDDDGRSI